MSHIPSSAILMAAAVIAAVIVGSFAFRALQSQNTAHVNWQSGKLTQLVNESDLATVNQTKIRGSDILGYIERYKNKDVSILVYNGNISRAYINTYDASSNQLTKVTNESSLVLAARDKSNTAYISPAQRYSLEIVRSSVSNEIMQLKFIVEGASGTDIPDGGSSGNTTNNRISITLSPNYPEGESSASTVVSVTKTNGHFPDVTLPTTLSKNGYIFAGWKYGNELFTSSIRGSKIDEIGHPFEMQGAWSPKKYTITFTMEGGSVDGNSGDIYIQKIHGQALKIDKKPERTGYTFAGYAKSSGGNVVYAYGDSIPATVNADMKLYAVWTAKKVIVNFNANGGTGNLESKIFSVGQTGTLPAIGDSITRPDETRGGITYRYTFRCWSTVSDGSGTNYADRASASFDSDTTLYAIWDSVADRYTLTYDLNGGSATSETETKTLGRGNIQLAGAIEREGYTFLGWNIGGTIYSAESTYYIDANTTATAAWDTHTGRTFNIQLYMMNSDGTYPSSSDTLNYIATTNGETIGKKEIIEYLGRLDKDRMVGVKLKNSQGTTYVVPEAVTVDGTTYTVSENVSIPIKADGTSTMTAHFPIRKYSSGISIYAESGTKITDVEVTHTNGEEKSFTSKIDMDKSPNSPVVTITPAGYGMTLTMTAKTVSGSTWVGWKDESGEIIATGRTISVVVNSTSSVPKYRAVAKMPTEP